MGLGPKQVQNKKHIILGTTLFYYLNPLTPKTDWHLTSLYNITPEFNIKVTRIKTMITN